MREENHAELGLGVPRGMPSKQPRRHILRRALRRDALTGKLIFDMGIADRDYHRHEHRSHRFLANLTPVVKALLAVNLGVFLLDYLILPMVFELRPGPPPILSWGAFTIQSALMEGRIWEFVSFQFIHASLGHVLFNSIGIYFFGPWLERWWGARKFLLFYLLCGAAGAAFFTLLTFLHVISADLGSPLVGASAGIYGIFIGVAVIAPGLRVALLFPPIELSMRQLAIGLMLLAVASILLNFGGNQGGEAGHLGGAILGLLLMRFPNLLGVPGISRGPRAHTSQPRWVPKLRPRTHLLHEEESKVDEILDKVSRDGFQSLTQDERDILQQAAARHRSDS